MSRMQQRMTDEKTKLEEELIDAAEHGRNEEVIRLLDEENVDVNCQDFVSFLSFFFISSFLG